MRHEMYEEVEMVEKVEKVEKIFAEARRLKSMLRPVETGDTGGANAQS